MLRHRRSQAPQAAETASGGGFPQPGVDAPPPPAPPGDEVNAEPASEEELRAQSQKTRAERRAERNAHRETEPRQFDRPVPRRPPRHLLFPGPPAAPAAQLDGILLQTIRSQQQPVEERQNILQCFEEMQRIVHSAFNEDFPGRFKLHIFGSCISGFGMRDADVDLCLQIRTESSDEAAAAVEKLAEAVKAAFPDLGDDADPDDPGVDPNGIRHADVLALMHARVPIVKIQRMPKRLQNIACDVCVNNTLAVVNTQLLKDYASIDPRLQQLAFAVKHWARRRKVNSTYHGTLSSYCWVIMCIFHLQTREPPILPCLQNAGMLKPTFRMEVNGHLCAYHHEVAGLKSFGKANEATVSELLTGFFDHWAFRHDYSRDVASIRTGYAVTKASKEWTTRVGKDRHLICVEDPFDLSHDLGRTVDRNSIGVLRDEFVRATRIMREERDPNVALSLLFEKYEPPQRAPEAAAE